MSLLFLPSCIPVLVPKYSDHKNIKDNQAFLDFTFIPISKKKKSNACNSESIKYSHIYLYDNLV